MVTRSLHVLSALALALAASAAVTVCQAQPPAPPPPRAIPGITASDGFPGGCVDCHVNRPDIGLDTRISVLMTRLAAGANPKLVAAARSAAAPGLALTGRHPDVPDVRADIPGACLRCHARGSDSAPEFARMLHTLHLEGGEANHFMTIFQGECTYCHKLDAATGSWSIPSGPEH